MAAVFAAASNTPLALSIMALELLGAGAFPHVVVVCVIAWVVSGRRSLYAAQLRPLLAAAGRHPSSGAPGTTRS
jgi:H+/Cl- antiporter ClcA